jgi:ABC-type glutathione transport system ATPase component
LCTAGAATDSALLAAVHLRKALPLPALNPLQLKRALQAAEDASLALYPRRAIALVGAGGNGKTTVASILACLYEPTGGVSLFRGVAWPLGAGGHTLRDVTVRIYDVDNHLYFPGAGPSTQAENTWAQHVDPAVAAEIAA